MSGVVVVLEPVIGGGAGRDVQNRNFQPVQRLVGLFQVSNQVPEAVVATWNAFMICFFISRLDVSAAVKLTVVAQVDRGRL